MTPYPPATGIVGIAEILDASVWSPNKEAEIVSIQAVFADCKTRHKKRLDIAAEFLESNGYTVTRPGAASSAAPTAAPTAADPKRPRVTAGLDTANVRGTQGKPGTRSSKVPEYSQTPRA